MSEKEIRIPELEEIQKEHDRIRFARKYWSVLRSTLFILVIVVAAALLVATFWLPVLRIYGSSMSPTLNDGDTVVCMKSDEYHRGDIIAVYVNNKLVIRRVIGVGGDSIKVREDGKVIVNGKEVQESYLSEQALGMGDAIYPVQVPEHTYFVLGDQRETAVDSRYTAVGCVNQEQVAGRLLVRLWPINQMEVFNGKEH